jgi:hypothetical protein
VPKRFAAGLALGLLLALPGVALAETPTSVSALCGNGSTPGAVPATTDPAGGRAPSVIFDDRIVGPLGNAPVEVFNRTGGCTFIPG